MFIKCILFFFVLGPITADYPLFSLSNTCTIPRLDHGRVKVRQRARLVKFMCLARYTLVGNSYATCRNGRWDVQIPVCIRSGCSDAPEISNGLQIPSYHNAWIMYFCLPGHKLKGSSTIFCDGRKWNATAPVCVDSSESTPLNCDFEDPDLCGWANSELHDFDWERLNKATPSSFLKTGPSFDHTYGKGGSGYYMYIETTSKYENDTARLVSPIYERKLLKDGCFSFFYHMYGNSTGGLKVYIKPDFLDLEQLIKPGENNQKYNLFEKWGNLGDFWYNSVTQLPDVEDNFQIVIEGIRGSSFTSDIAIDDVAILQGSNCTVEREAAVTPPEPTLVDSCTKRCFTNDTQPFGCSCSKYCFLHDNCCQDFFDICIFQADFALAETSETSEVSEIIPQTQKLVATTPETTSTSTTTTTTTRKPTTTSTSTTSTTTTTTTTTTPRPTTIKTTQRTTTKKVTTPPTTTSRIFTTTKKPSTPKPIRTTTKAIQTTKPATKQPTRTKPTTIKTTISTISTTIRTTTNIPFGISRTIENHNDYHDIVEKAKKEKEKEEIETRKISHMHIHDSQKNTSSGWKIFFIIIGVAACIGAASWFSLVARSTRGSVTIARLRGRINHDPEVSFLSTDVDDD